MAVEIKLDDDTWRRLQALAEPLVETVDDVLRRLLDAYQPNQTHERAAPASLPRPSRANGVRTRIPRGQRLPVYDFKLPILFAVQRLGGQGRSREILIEVEQRLQDRLNDIDYALVQGRPRWEKTGHFARLELVEEELLDAPSHGIWRLTEKGQGSINPRSANAGTS